MARRTPINTSEPKSNVVDVNNELNSVLYDTEFIHAIHEGDDKGIQIKGGELTVGTPDDPHEFVCGGGDSYPVSIAYHCDIANTTGLNITSATDITTILQSDNLSTTGLFGGITTGKYILVGSDYKYAGVKVKVDTYGDVDSDNVQGYYLRNNSPTWIASPYMVTNAEFPYQQLGRDLCGCASKSEQWRFGFDPNDPTPEWNQVTLTINGVATTKYWAKFELVGNIVADPLIEQVKLHTNRFEANADGSTEYFGRARYPKSLIFGLQDLIANNNSDPADQVVDYTPNFSAKFINNKFANNAVDGFGIIQPIEIGMDTSIPLQLFISYYVDGPSTGDVNFHVEIIRVEDGFVYDGTNVADQYDIIDTVTVDSNLVRRSVSTNIDVSKLKPNSGIFIDIHRDATAGNTLDTIPANIVITNVALTGYFWRP